MVSIIPERSSQAGTLPFPEGCTEMLPELTSGRPNARESFPPIAEFKTQQTKLNRPNLITGYNSSPIPLESSFQYECSMLFLQI